MRRIVLLSLLLCVPPAFAQTDVLTQRNDNLRTGQNLNETTLTPSNVKAATFGKLLAFSVDGQVYAQPLYKSNVSIPGQGIHNVLYVATEHDSVYAFDADGQTTTPLWQVSFINPAANIVPALSTDVGATDIQPEIGITGTPVIDPITGTLYVVTRAKESGTHFQRLHALDIATGAEKFGGPVVIQASVSSSGGSVVFDPLRHLQRPGLVLANNTVYVGFASHGDVTPYHGWVMAYNATTLQQVAAYTTTLNGVQGGIWMSGAGLAADPSGNIYFSVGNGDFDGLTNFGDSCVKLSTTTGLALSDYFAPFNQSALSAADLDVSSGGVTLLPDAAGSAAHPHLLVVAGKDGTIYVLDRDHLGGFNSSTSNPDSQIVQEIWNALGNTPIDVTQPSLPYVNNNFSTAAYWQNNLYWGGVSDQIKMFKVTNGLLSTTPASQSPTAYASNRGASPMVSANGATNGIVWAIENATNAVLHAYDATNLANELYNSNQAAASRDVPGASVKFVVPTITNGKVYVGTQNRAAVYGLLGSTQPQAATPTFSPAAGTFSTVQNVTISDATAGAAIYYTTDGSTPTTSSTLYTGPITVNVATMTIKAIATASGFLTSLTATATYNITQASTAAPTFSPAGGVYNTAQSVTISDATAGAAIHYTTDGSTPTASSTLYSGPIAANTAMTTIKAMALAPSSSGLLNSTVATAAYILRPAVPTFSPPGGTYNAAQNVTISEATAGAAVYYTTDGSTPTTASAPYTGPIAVNTGTLTIKAMAISGGLFNSAVATANYTITLPSSATPTFSPAAGIFGSPQSVTISDTTSGALVYYSTDGSTPTTTSTPYSGPITVSTTTTIKAMATASGFLDSAVATASYTITTYAATPTLNPPGGVYNTPQSVTLADTTAGAVIYYTTDGSAPTTASTQYTAPIPVNTASTTIKAMAAASGFLNSAVATANYLLQPVTPTFNPAGGTYNKVQSVTISDATSGSAIYYTTDGTSPTIASTLYSGPVAVNTSMTISAIAVAGGVVNSASATAIYVIQAAPPTFSPGPGTYGPGQTVAISDATPGALIYYTTNGTTPTTASTLYSGPITVSTTTTINAIAVANGLLNSAVATGTYSVQSGGFSYGAGFPSSTGLTLNGLAKITTSRLRITDGGSMEANSAFYNSPMNVQAFTNDFSFLLTNPNADGFTFTLQGNSPTAVGGTGGGLGFGPDPAQPNGPKIGKSVAIKFDLFNNSGEGTNSTGLFTNGAIPTTPATDLTPSGVSLHSGHTFNVHMTYNGTALAVQITDATNSAKTFSASFPVDIPGTVGGPTAYVGFTGGTGGQTATQDILTWSYVTAPPTAAAPTFSPVEGTYVGAQSVTISDSTPGASIYYTTDGSTPTTASTLYSGPITVSATTAINAIAAASGLSNSAVGTATYTIQSPPATPTFSPAPGNYSSAQSVTISDATPGAAIYYTTDGSTPTTASTLYSGPITVSATTTINAVAASGFLSSGLAAATYAIVPPAATPTFSPAPGTYTSAQSVTISDTTPSAAIYYTTNGSTPTTASTLYTGAITVSSTITIQAIAVSSATATSAVATATYAFPPPAATPTFSPPTGTYSTAQSVTISDTTPGATIYYTTAVGVVGGDPTASGVPTTSSTPYTGPISITTTTTIYAIAAADGFSNSGIALAAYSLQTATPTFSPVAGTYTAAQSVTISDTTPGAAIYYTTDGSTPTTSSTPYSGPIALNTNGTTTINAIAVASGFLSSQLAKATFTINIPPAAMPTFSPAAGTYNGAQSVTISDTTPGAAIYYTTDGSAPTTSSTPYSGPIAVNATTTVQAIAVAAGYLNSAVASAVYTLQAATPTFSPAAGTYNGAQSVAISDTTPGAAIYYTTNGSTPTLASTLYTGPIAVNATTTINAMAALAGYSNSGVATAAYTLQVATPTFSPAAGVYNTVQSVTISDTTPGAAIYYTTNGSTPTLASTLYTGPIALNTSGTITINAIAAASGYSNSALGTATYTLNLPPAAASTFSPAAGTYTTMQSVTISDTTPGAAIYYTTNGTVPTASSMLYTGPIALNVSGTTTINAIAVASGYSNSAVATATFTINLPVVAAPTFSPTPGLYLTAQSVTISTATAGASIYYTTNGSAPTTSSNLYVGPISVSINTTINAVAVTSGFTNSGVVTAPYTIQPPISYASGFTSTGLTLNGPAKITSSRLRITDGGSMEASSAFYNSQMNVQAFTNDFSFLLTNPSADGFTFTLQGNSPTAVGGTGGGLGYGPDPGQPNGPKIGKSVAIKLDLFSNSGEGTNSTGLFTNGAIPTTPATDLTPSGVSLHSGHTFNVHMTYNGTALAVQITDATNSAKTFSASFPVDIPGTVGGPTAYVGFTGGTGGLTATQDILTWTYVPGQPVVGAPTILPVGGTYNAAQSVTISDPTPGAQIYYTTDGSSPTTSSTLYAGPISVNSSMTLTAVGAINGFLNSTVATATYTLQVAKPTLSLAGGTYNSVQSLTISDTTAGAQIYYTTDGSTPTTASTLYSGPINVNSSMTVTAIGAISGFSNSAVATASYALQAATPAFSPAGGTYSKVQSVTLSDPGVQIYYTTDGSTPTTASTLYAGPISVNTTMTIKAIGATSGFLNSGVATATYTLQAATPTFSPAAGNYNTAQSVTISDTTPGALIYYTTNGSTPTTSSTLYAGPITVNTNMTINAIATASGFVNSAVATATYNVQATTPTFSPAAGTYTTVQSVTISDATPGAKIYYTTNGSTPTTSSTLYAGPIAVNTTTTIKAIAAVSGLANSPVATATYTLNLPSAATPTFAPPGATYNTSTSVSVTLSDATSGASIYYTADGTTPTTASTLYTAPIPVSTTTTIKAIAAAGGFVNSAVATATYTIQPPISGPPSFGAGFTSMGINLNGPATINTNRLRLTDGGSMEASSAFYNLAVNVQAFTNDFSFQLTSATADGFTFTLQGNGPLAVGGPGGGLGYGPDPVPPPSGPNPSIGKSVAIKFDLFNNSGEGANSTGLFTNGATPTLPAIDLTPSGIDLHSGHVFNVHMTYNDATLAMTITDTTNSSTFTTSFPVDIPGTVGGPTAYVGFTGGTGGLTAVQDILTWTYVPGQPTAATPTFTPVAGTYVGAQSVTISDITPGAAIYYTIDGSTPTTSSILYTGPITVSTTTTINAIAVASGYLNSAVATTTYTIH